MCRAATTTTGWLERGRVQAPDLWWCVLGAHRYDSSAGLGDPSRSVMELAVGTVTSPFPRLQITLEVRLRGGPEVVALSWVVSLQKAQSRTCSSSFSSRTFSAADSLH